MGDFWTEKQKQDIDYFNKNLETWTNNPLYRLKFVIISGKELKGIYDTFEAALSVAAVSYGGGEYIIQQILPEKETVNFLYPALASAAYAQSINLGDFPSGSWVDSNYDAVWEFSATNIRILSTSGEVLWDFAGKTIQNFRVSVDGTSPVISFSCPEAGRSYRFVKPLTNANLNMQIERSGLPQYSVTLTRK